MFRLEEAAERNTKNIRIVRSSHILGQFFRPSLVSKVAKWVKNIQNGLEVYKKHEKWWVVGEIYERDTQTMQTVLFYKKRSLALLEAISDESIHRFVNSERPNMKAFRWFSRNHETRFCTAGRARKRTKNNDFTLFLVFCDFVLIWRKPDLPDELKLCSTVTFLCTQVGSTV